MTMHDPKYQELITKYMQRMYFRNIDRREVYYVRDFLEFYKEFMGFHKFPFLCLAMDDLVLFGDDRHNHNDIGGQILQYLYKRTLDADERERMERMGISILISRDEYFRFLRIGLTELGISETRFDGYIEEMDKLPVTGVLDSQFSNISQFVRIGMLREILNNDDSALFVLGEI